MDTLTLFTWGYWEKAFSPATVSGVPLDALFPGARRRGAGGTGAGRFAVNREEVRRCLGGRQQAAEILLPGLESSPCSRPPHPFAAVLVPTGWRPHVPVGAPPCCAWAHKLLDPRSRKSRPFSLPGGQRRGMMGPTLAGAHRVRVVVVVVVMASCSWGEWDRGIVITPGYHPHGLHGFFRSASHERC
jgi:hypothetical protein